MKDWLETYWFMDKHRSKVLQLKEIAAGRGIPVSTARGHLKGLIRLGFVKQQGYGLYKVVPPEDYRDALEIARAALSVVEKDLPGSGDQDAFREAKKYLDVRLKELGSSSSVL